MCKLLDNGGREFVDEPQDPELVDKRLLVPPPLLGDSSVHSELDADRDAPRALPLSGVKFCTLSLRVRTLIRTSAMRSSLSTLRVASVSVLLLLVREVEVVRQEPAGVTLVPDTDDAMDRSSWSRIALWIALCFPSGCGIARVRDWAKAFGARRWERPSLRFDLV